MNPPSASSVGDFIDRQRITGFQWLVVGLCFCVLVLDGFDTAAIGYIAPALVQEWHLPKASLGPVLSAALFGLAIGAIAAGPLADRFGRKAVLVAATAFFGVASLATAMSGSVDTMTAWRFVTGLGLGAAMPNAATLTAEYVPARHRSLLTNAMFCGFPLGAAGGGLIAAGMISAHGWRSVLLVAGVLPLVLAIVLLWRLPESLRYLVATGQPADRILRLMQRMGGSLSQPVEVPKPASTLDAAPRQRAIAVVLSRRYVFGSAMLWIGYFMGLVIFYLVTSWMPVLMRGTGFSVERATLLTALFPLGGGIGAIAAGFLMDRVNAQVVVAAAYALTAVFIFAISRGTGSLAMLSVLIFLAGTAMNGAQTAMPALAAQFYPTEGRATGVSWMMGIGRCGGIVGALAGAELLRRQLSFETIFALATVPAVISTLALIAKYRAYRRDPVSAMDIDALKGFAAH